MLLAHKFRDFLYREGHTRESFGRLMGVHPSLLSRLIPSNGNPPVREPRFSTLRKLVEASGGKIAFDDFCKRGAFVRNDNANSGRCPICGAALANRQCRRHA